MNAMQPPMPCSYLCQDQSYATTYAIKHISHAHPKLLHLLPDGTAKTLRKHGAVVEKAPQVVPGLGVQPADLQQQIWPSTRYLVLVPVRVVPATKEQTEASMARTNVDKTEPTRWGDLLVGRTTDYSPSHMPPPCNPQHNLTPPCILHFARQIPQCTSHQPKPAQPKRA